MKKFLFLFALLFALPVAAYDLNPSLEIGYGLTTNGDTVETDKSIAWVEGKIRTPVYENVQGYLGLSWLGEGESDLEELTPSGNDTLEQNYYAYGVWWGVEFPTTSRTQLDLGVGIQAVDFDETGTDVTAGLRAGVNYGITKNWTVSAKYLYFFDGGETDIGTAIAAVRYNF